MASRGQQRAAAYELEGAAEGRWFCSCWLKGLVTGSVLLQVSRPHPLDWPGVDSKEVSRGWWRECFRNRVIGCWWQVTETPLEPVRAKKVTLLVHKTLVLSNDCNQ